MKKMSKLLIAGITALSLGTFPQAATAISQQSTWANDEIQQAESLNLVPDTLEGKWQEDITRKDFCKLAVLLLKARSYNVEDLNWKNVKFADTDDQDVKIMKAAGGVQGKRIAGEKVYFAPSEPITRQEAAKMLFALTQTSALPKAETVHLIPHVWNDRNLPSYVMPNGVEACYLAPWARTGADFCYNAGVMSGVGENCFAPNDTYTVEQAVSTMLRLYKWSTGAAPSKSEGIVFETYDPAAEVYTWKDIEGNEILTGKNDTNEVSKYGYIILQENEGNRIFDQTGQPIAQNNQWNGTFDSVHIVSKNRACVKSKDWSSALISLPEGHVIAAGLFALQEGITSTVVYNADTVDKQNEGNPFWCARQGLLDANGDVLVPAEYTNIGLLYDGVIFARKESTSPALLLNYKGQSISDQCGIDWNKYDFYSALGRCVTVTSKIDGSYAVFDYNGKEIVPSSEDVELAKNFDYIAFGDLYRKTASIYTRNGTKRAALMNVDIGMSACAYRYSIGDSEGRTSPYLCGPAGGKISGEIQLGFSLVSDGGSAMVYMTSDSQAIVIDDMGQKLSSYQNVESADFVNGMVRIKNKNGVYSFYTPSGTQLQ